MREDKSEEAKGEDRDTFVLQVDIGEAEKSRLPWNMLEHNRMAEFLPFHYYYKDDKVCFCYSTGGLQPVSDFFRHKHGDFQIMYFLCSEIVRILEQGEAYLLNPGEYLLAPDRIYWSRLQKKVCLCYLPGRGGSLKKEYTTLVEYLMQYTDHREEKGVAFIYALYDSLTSDCFSLEALKCFLSDYSGQALGVEGKNTSERLDSGGKLSGRREQEEKKFEKATGSEVSAECGNSSEKYVLLYEGTVWGDLAIWNGSIGEYPVSEGREIFVGRARGGDVVIPCPEISREHAVIYREGRRLFLMDRGSTNGTYLNGRLLSEGERVSCREGDSISFAGYAFQLTCERGG